ncbi:hypothetical protein FIV06_31465 (plasmid) [Labrenzia sp. THAF191b]|uniref:DUF3991 domain-containing protein n=1 Tax=Roseibium alexandrii (strain DSM 17067 / NCIMB 14079 / DFL-11) TaxID=244592 RepID=A0A5E8H7V7_ROSAD|nr:MULTISPECIES: DUF3991 and toprim domain-containing protein [Stappiaceae]EEE48160.1 hypothetical protein SADFL11_54 [Roseibium alexandrii DFL-11]QFT01996.1 hypothetical protein FIV06_31465 [Labrenzia sp. THAF191b]QFT08285.1 hypothetical protein FIV05_31340 [Labrenzia sp. THAF191a]QFT19847.1 hypothetical protein FIV03_31445 [Labrenzia sp. THAF187b]QFT71185.1 hypothetical protein FIU93_30630 [Labrenzia sp. THAF35]
MEKADLKELKEKVACGAVLESSGFAVDRQESTRRAVKYRRDGNIIIVIHEGRGWFDPLSEAKGDVFRLVEHLDGLPFAAALHVVTDLVGFRPAEPAWIRQAREKAPHQTGTQRWQNRRKPWCGSSSWRYLHDARGIPEPILRRAVADDLLRDGPHGSMWAGHTDEAGHVTGWEERGPRWRGFASGGAKILFRLGPVDATRLCVTEAAIDAMSLAAIEDLRPGSLYLSTGGGWSPSTEAALHGLASRPDVLLVAATDANSQGETFAERLRILAEENGCNWQRLRPPSDDWNACLKEKE